MLIGHVEDIEALREKYEEIYTKLKMRGRHEIRKEIKEEEKLRWEQ